MPVNFAYKYLFHLFTSPPKDVVLRIYRLGWLWTRETWVQWKAR
jgi:hypothetical protein